MMVLSPTSELYENWANPTGVEAYQKFYFFDFQNADDIMSTGAKPRVVEKGPYTYR